MKKTTILNAQLSHVIATMGHTDGLTICDAGLPIPTEQHCIDLALTKGIPDFLSVLQAVSSELFIEKIVLAEEIKNINPQIEQQLLMVIQQIEVQQKIPLRLNISHITNLNIKVIKPKPSLERENVARMQMLFFIRAYHFRWI